MVAGTVPVMSAVGVTVIGKPSTGVIVSIGSSATSVGVACTIGVPMIALCCVVVGCTVTGRVVAPVIASTVAATAASMVAARSVGDTEGAAGSCVQLVARIRNSARSGARIVRIEDSFRSRCASDGQRVAARLKREMAADSTRYCTTRK